MAKNTNKMHFAKVERFNSEQVNFQEKIQGKYVKSGNDNRFPQYLIDLYNRSAIHAACVDSIVHGVIGQGLTANEELLKEKSDGKQMVKLSTYYEDKKVKLLKLICKKF